MIPPPPLPEPPPLVELAPVTPHLAHAFGGIWRLTLRRFLLPSHWLLLGGMLLVLIPFFAPVTVNDEVARREFMDWTIARYLTILVPMLAFITAGSAMRDEMKPGMADYVFTRPIARPAFVVFKYISHVVCAQVDFLFAFAVVMAMGKLHHVPGLRDALPALLGTQLLVVAAFSALGFAASVVTSRYIVVGLAYAALIEAGLGQIPTQISRLSMRHQVQVMLERFVWVDPAVLANPPDVVAAPPSAVVTVGLLLAFTVIMLVVAAVVFSFLELISAEDA